MKLIINRSQKASKKGILRGEKILLLNLDLEAELTDEEYGLLEKYYEPEVVIYKYIDEEEEDAEELTGKLKEIIDDSRTSFFMSDFRISAETEEGIKDIFLLDKIIEAAETGLKKEINKLKKLDSWKGEEKKEI